MMKWVLLVGMGAEVQGIKLPPSHKKTVPTTPSDAPSKSPAPEALLETWGQNWWESSDAAWDSVDLAADYFNGQSQCEQAFGAGTKQLYWAGHDPTEIEWVMRKGASCDVACATMKNAAYSCDQESLSLQKTGYWNSKCMSAIIQTQPNDPENTFWGGNQNKYCAEEPYGADMAGGMPVLYNKTNCDTTDSRYTSGHCYLCDWRNDGTGAACSERPIFSDSSRLCPCFKGNDNERTTTHAPTPTPTALITFSPTPFPSPTPLQFYAVQDRRRDPDRRRRSWVNPRRRRSDAWDD